MDFMSDKRVTLHIYLDGGSEIHVPLIDPADAEKLVKSFRWAMGSNAGDQNVSVSNRLIDINTPNMSRCIRGDSIIGYELKTN